MAAAPPKGRAHPPVNAPARAWGSLTCSPENHALVLGSQPLSHSGSFFASHWSLWQIGLNVSRTRLTSPPPSYTENPRASPTTATPSYSSLGFAVAILFTEVFFSGVLLPTVVPSV
jgi:hypothetical protein